MMSSMLIKPTNRPLGVMGTPENRCCFIRCWMCRSESVGAAVIGGLLIASRTRNS